VPVNVSKPDWACEVCGTRFREDHAAAARCEAAPVPDLLPEGTPLLSVAQGRLTLVPLTHTGHIGTRATSYTDTTGHFHHYRRGDVPVEGNMLVPGTAGHVQHLGGRSLTLYGVRADNQPAQVSIEALREAAGLVINGEGDDPFVSTTSPSRAAPITGPVRAVLDMLGARLVRSRNVYHQRSLVQAWLVEQQGGCQRVARGLTHVVDHYEVGLLGSSGGAKWPLLPRSGGVSAPAGWRTSPVVRGRPAWAW